MKLSRVLIGGFELHNIGYACAAMCSLSMLHSSVGCPNVEDIMVFRVPTNDPARRLAKWVVFLALFEFPTPGLDFRKFVPR